MSIITIPPRFVERPDVINDEQKKQVKLLISDVSESEALIVMEEDLNQKLVNYIKAMARKSFEYKEYIRIFKDHLNLTECKVFGIDVAEIKGVGIEVHHTPFSMETIVNAVLSEMVNTQGFPIDPKDVADNVMKLHYEGIIGLIPLTSTIHEAVHSNAVYIKKSDIYGDFNKFYERYEEYLSDDAIDHYNNVMRLSDEQVDLYNKEKLKRIISEYEVVYENDYSGNQ